ncbi:MAG: dihydrodipicolinate synthase family protein [Dietzia sp.]|nr:dihydrodipicolinate synthase family protein [Dietzia sp.]
MVPTPFSADGTAVDHHSLAALVTELVRRGVSGLVAMGVIAEPRALTSSERLTALETIVASSGDLPLCIGLTEPEHRDRVREAERMSDIGSGRDLSILIPVTTPDARLLRAQWSDIYDRTGASLIVQDYPAASGITIELAELADAVRGLHFIEAVKSEAPPTFWRIHHLSESIGVPCMAGLGGISLIDELECGASSVACGISRPEVVRRALTQWVAGDSQKARATMSEIASLINFEIQAKTSIAIRKEHWRRQGVISSSAVRAPSYPYDPFLDRCSTAHGFPRLETALR